MKKKFLKAFILFQIATAGFLPQYSFAGDRAKVFGVCALALMAVTFYRFSPPSDPPFLQPPLQWSPPIPTASIEIGSDPKESTLHADQVDWKAVAQGGWVEVHYPQGYLWERNRDVVSQRVTNLSGLETTSGPEARNAVERLLEAVDRGNQAAQGEWYDYATILIKTNRRVFTNGMLLQYAISQGSMRDLLGETLKELQQIAHPDERVNEIMVFHTNPGKGTPVSPMDRESTDRLADAARGYLHRITFVAVPAESHGDLIFIYSNPHL